ncbi:hypothetical protein HRS9139_01541 [Pyrenophora teres f. teres]|nr:hypothetical protein HRS9139_01541 [Pyrenophora teres f. teres]KAE8851281.1 hypothetical protein HRS9122_01568 [Pyrenophora teres f. teres]KAE8869954.1 hypothetical protein PTNB29_00298 [Pyrenophora teres f. teres]
MASRKAIAANGDAGEGPFKWEGPNDNKLLLITQGRYLTTAFPGTTTGSIRNRISALRVKQRDFYESMGWTLPEGGATKKTPSKKKTPIKRDAEDAGVDDAEEAEQTPSKKAKSAAEAEEGSESEGKKVKDEAGDEEDM